jgi:Cu/Ag efflux protein CusF
MKMKTLGLKRILLALLASQITSFNSPARADEAAPATAAITAENRSFTGTVKRLDDKERTLVVDSFFLTRSFTAGNHCRVELEDKPNSALKDLRPGHRVQVQYQTKDGVNVAARISQENASFTGHVTSLDPAGKTFKVKQGVSTKAFALGDGCKITVRDEKGHAFGDLKLGHKVTVRYASSVPQNVAFTITQSSLDFTGTIEAIDAGAGTLKARQMVGGKTFKMGEDCPILVEGRTGAKLRDLRIGDKINFQYEDVDGVLVANRIALEGPAAPTAEAARPVRKEAMNSPSAPAVAR